MNLIRTENGLQVHHGGKADDREIGPEHELAVAMDKLSCAIDRLADFHERLFWELPPGRRAEILKITPYIERRLRREHQNEKTLKGGSL